MEFGKAIKSICYTIIVIVDVIAFFLMLYGLREILFGDSVRLGIILIVISIILSAHTLLSVYPLLALSKIEKHTSDMNDQLDEIIVLLEDATCGKAIVTIGNNAASLDATSTTTSRVNYDDSFETAIDFVNHKYGLQFSANDNLQSIKEKVLEIDDQAPSAQTFKNRILSADSFDEIKSLFKMHLIVNKK